MRYKDKYTSFQKMNSIIIVLVLVTLYFGYSYSHRLHVVYGESRTEIADDMIVTSATTHLEPRLNSGGFTDITNDLSSKIKVKIETVDGEEVATVTTPEGKFTIDIYTMRDYDLDLGLTPKNIGEYPKIECSSIGQFSTGGIIVEITQRYGAETYANRVYIKEDKLVDYGFTKKVGIRDQTIYYDNVVMIVNTLSNEEHDLIRVYDDSTDQLLFKYSTSQLESNASINANNIMCEAVGMDFIALSSRYTDQNIEFFVDFSDENSTFKSVWDYVDLDDDEMEVLKYYESATRGNTLVFAELDSKNNLVYEIRDVVNNTFISDVVIPLNSRKTFNFQNQVLIQH